MTRPTSRPDDGSGGNETFEEGRALEHLIEPADPVVFDPNPTGSDMPKPTSGSGSSGDGGGSDQSADTAD